MNYLYGGLTILVTWLFIMSWLVIDDSIDRPFQAKCYTVNGTPNIKQCEMEHAYCYRYVGEKKLSCIKR